MDLLEYQAKELFTQVGIPILPSQTISDPRSLKKLQIPYPVVLKSQVRAGGRGKAGGVRFVENTIDAIAAARIIFNLPILGQYPQVLLAEARYNTQQEFFLAVVLDYQLKRPVLLGSSRGGVDVEALLQNIQQVVVEDEFSPFYARRLTIKMGLRGSLIESVSAIVEKMYYLFIEKDLDLIEINPLGISAEGEVMALDGKITLNDNACERHSELVALKAEKEIPSKYSFLQPISTSTLTSPKLRWLDWDSEQGKIGIICNSFGLALITWDSISQAKGKSAGCWIVGEETTEKLLPNSYSVQQLEIALEQIKEIPGIKVVLVNILASPEITEITASAIATYLQPESINPQDSESYLLPTRWRERNFSHGSPKGRSLGQLHFVVRLVGGKIDAIKAKLGSMPVYWTENLDEAVEKTISLAKSR